METDYTSLEKERDTLGGQLQLALAKADSEQLARSIAEEQLSDVEKEKTMLELELKEAINRHKSELSKKDFSINNVYNMSLLGKLSYHFRKYRPFCMFFFYIFFYLITIMRLYFIFYIFFI